MTTSTASPAGCDQATQLRALVASLRQHEDPTHQPPAPSPPARPAVPIIAIGSGKGGVGKTCLGVNLSIALRSQQTQPVLVDADLGSANADVLLGVAPTRRLDRALVGDARPGDLLVDAPGGIRCLPGIVGRSDLATPMRVQRLVAGLAPLDRHCDAIVIDTAAGNTSQVRTLLHHADLALIVVIPEPTSIADAYALIKLLRTDRDQSPTAHAPEIALVINQADPDQAKRVADRITRVCDRFLGWQPTRLGSVPRDAQIPASVARRRPLQLADPTAPASLAIASIAQSVRKRFGL